MRWSLDVTDKTVLGLLNPHFLIYHSRFAAMTRVTYEWNISFWSYYLSMEGMMLAVHFWFCSLRRMCIVNKSNVSGSVFFLLPGAPGDVICQCGCGRISFRICRDDEVINVSDGLDDVWLHVFVLAVMVEMSCSTMIESMKIPIAQAAFGVFIQPAVLMRFAIPWVWPSVNITSSYMLRSH